MVKQIHSLCSHLIWRTVRHLHTLPVKQPDNQPFQRMLVAKVHKRFRQNTF